MRRKEKEIKDSSEIEAIIRDARVCRLALSENDRPYIVPLCFGYKDNALYFHGAGEGKKIDMVKENPRVCFEFDIQAEPIEAEDPCFWGMKFKSVIGFGTASLVTDEKEKETALGIIMGQYSDRRHSFDADFVRATTVIQVEVEEMTGKQSDQA
jgi:uncharacterized protein